MNNQDRYRIVPVEISVTLIGMIIGVGILTLPRSLAQEVGTSDGWISIIIGAISAMLLVSVYVRLQRHFPELNLLQFIGKSKIGNWISKALGILFITYFILLLAFEARILSLVVGMYLLVNTPSEIIVALILLTTSYAVGKGVQGIIHLNLMFVPFTVLFLLVIVIFNLQELNINELRPVLPEGITPVLKGVKQTLVSFLGIEILFFFMAYMRASEVKALPLNISIAFISILYIMITVVSFSLFSIETTGIITFPTVEVAKEVEIPGGLFERLESLVITIWIMSIFNTMSIAQLLANNTLTTMFFQKKQKAWWIPGLIASIAFIIAFIPRSITEAFTLGDWVGRVGISLFIVGLVCGFFFVWIRKKR
jgi:spore germination protein